MSYDEHLISMAGGDGDVLDQIEARIRDCKTYKFGMRNADKLAHEDAPALLAMVLEQRAVIERLGAGAWDMAAWEARELGLFYDAEHKALIAANPYRAALTAPDPS